MSPARWRAQLGRPVGASVTAVRLGNTARASFDAALTAPIAEFMARPKKEFRARLVEIGWSLGGGGRAVPTGLPQALELIHAGSLIIDDIQDQSTERRGGAALHRAIGLPLALNAGNYLYFVALESLRALELSAARERVLYRGLTQAMRRCHEGQALDLCTHIADLPQNEVAPTARAISSLKTGSLTDAAIRLGALAAGAPTRLSGALGRFGHDLGVGLQMLDDYGNLCGAREPNKRYEDLRHGRVSWPWAWLAQALASGEYQTWYPEMRALREGGDPGVVAERLLAAVSVRGRACARQHLGHAVMRLQSVLGASTDLRTVWDEIERLENSYG